MDGHYRWMDGNGNNIVHIYLRGMEPTNEKKTVNIVKRQIICVYVCLFTHHKLVFVGLEVRGL